MKIEITVEYDVSGCISCSENVCGDPNIRDTVSQVVAVDKEEFVDVVKKLKALKWFTIPEEKRRYIERREKIRKCRPNIEREDDEPRVVHGDDIQLNNFRIISIKKFVDPNPSVAESSSIE